MKKNSFDKVIEKYIKYSEDDIKYLNEFYDNPSISMKDYYRWRSASMTCFTIHYLSFWHNPNDKDFEGVIDAFMMAYLAQLMYLFDKEKKFHQNLVVGVPLFLAILSFGGEREIDLMFHAIISLINDQIEKRRPIYYQNKTLQEAFVLYDLYTNNKNHDIWQPYITESLDCNYQKVMDIIFSDNENEVNNAIAEMMKYHRKKAHIESFVTNEFYSIEWRVFPIEIIILMRYRYLQGKSIDFIEHEVLSKFIPYLKKEEYTLSSEIETAKMEIYEMLSLNQFLIKK